MLLFAGVIANVGGANDNVFHALQGLFNSSSSSVYIDGSLTTGLNPGTANATAQLCMGKCNNGLDGNAVEAGRWAGDKSASWPSLNGNQRAYWGFQSMFLSANRRPP